MTVRTVPIDSIQVGERDRTDLGDVIELAASIAAVGLLHPVVVTDALTLVAGDRRLAAVRHLGWTEVPVTVVDLATAADVLRAEADENTCRKPLSPYEASRARERRSKVLAPMAREAKEANLRQGEEPRSAKLADRDRPKPVGEVRKIAAAGTGYSGSTLDKVDKIRDVAERGVVKHGRREVPAPPEVVEVAAVGLEDVKKTGAAVERVMRQVDAAIRRHVPADPDHLHRAWRRDYLAAISAARKLLRFTAADVAANADAECLDELKRFAESVATYAADVHAAATSTENVIQIGGRR